MIATWKNEPRYRGAYPSSTLNIRTTILNLMRRLMLTCTSVYDQSDADGRLATPKHSIPTGATATGGYRKTSKRCHWNPTGERTRSTTSACRSVVGTEWRIWLAEPGHIAKPFAVRASASRHLHQHNYMDTKVTNRHQKDVNQNWSGRKLVLSSTSSTLKNSSYAGIQLKHHWLHPTDNGASVIRDLCWKFSNRDRSAWAIHMTVISVQVWWWIVSSYERYLVGSV